MFRAVLIAALVLALLPAAAHACAGADTDPEHLSARGLDRALLCLVNVERRAAGVAPVAPNRRLRASARAYAAQMVRGRFFSHTGSGEAPHVRVRAAGYLEGRTGRWTVGENLAWGAHGVDETPRDTVRKWMDSPAHREVMLMSVFRSLGTGAALATPQQGPGATFVAHFGS